MDQERREKPREEFVREWIPVKTNDAGIAVSRLRVPTGWLVRVETQLYDYDGSGTPVSNRSFISITFLPTTEEW